MQYGRSLALPVAQLLATAVLAACCAGYHATALALAMATDSPAAACTQAYSGPNHAFYAAGKVLRSDCQVDKEDMPGNDATAITSRSASGKLNVGQTRGWNGAVTVARFEGTVDEFHEAFSSKDAFVYKQLERRHDYIQWLFPSPEASRFNAESLPLSDAEAKAMMADDAIVARIERSFRLILDFWGFELHDAAAPEPEEEGGVDALVTATEGLSLSAVTVTRFTKESSPEGFARLARINSPGDHNFLRVNRVLKCLHFLGKTAWQEAFLKALHKECFQTGGLSAAAMSFINFWSNTTGWTEQRLRKEFPLPGR